MSIAGLRKQFNKANQYVSEKIGGAKGTELEDDFLEMERKIDVMTDFVDKIINQTHEFLQPNPGHRVKLATMSAYQKMRGQARSLQYPQPEAVMAETMNKTGSEFNDTSPFAMSLAEAGESYKQLADIKYSLEDNVKQNFLEPLQHLATKDLKEVAHHRKKLHGRRLDYDCKKRKQQKAAGGAINEDELHIAEEKFEESKNLAEIAMQNVLDNDVEQISQLASFVEAQIDYHRQAQDVLQGLFETLQNKQAEAANRPRVQREKKTFNLLPRSNNDNISDAGSDYAISPMTTPTHHPNKDLTTPQARALYDFEAENESELEFKENEIITLTQQLDENWYEGEIHGRTGLFPCNYVEVIVPL
ncbi:endophilin-A-like [Tubulanus polymorphus]|uniref:endophilin-A-like n=1 Tax=Tubulanus polymorphus TaxID=672921 RepID=UPI003DA649C6